MRGVLLGVILLAFQGNTQDDSRAEKVLLGSQDHIRSAAGIFGISPRLLASVVYAEQLLNVKPGENVLDVVFARTGYNSSIGIAQIKLQTAAWIENKLHDPDSRCYLGGEAAIFLPKSRSYSELIDRLSADSLNLLYAAAYLAMIDKLWGETLQAQWLQDSKPGILATLYSLGVVKPDGSLRTSHDQPTMNQFGRIAQEFFDSFLLRAEFAE